MMDPPRQLQHASLALEKSGNATDSLFPYLISVFFAIFAVYLALRYSYLWMCRVVCGREPPPKPLNGEEILANMTDEERKAVFHAVVKKLCKTATVSDIPTPRRKPKENEEKKDADAAPIADLEIPDSTTLETADLDASEKPLSNDGSSELPSPMSVDDKYSAADLSNEVSPSTSHEVDVEAPPEDAKKDPSIDEGDLSKATSHDTADSKATQEETRSLDIEEGSGTAEAANEEDKDPSLNACKSHQEGENMEAPEVVAITTTDQSDGIEAGPSKSEDPATDYGSCGDIEEGVQCHCPLDAGVDEEDNKAFLPSLRSPMQSPLPYSSRRGSFLSQPSVDGSAMMGHDVCSICLGDYQLGNMLFVSKHCGHVFHMDCILEWLDKHEECPVCRVKMVTQEEMVEAAVEFVQKNTTAAPTTEDAAADPEDHA